MGRPEAPITGESRIEALARDLRDLRRSAGEPSYRLMETRVHFSYTTLSKAAAGQRLPSLEVTLAYVRACGGDETQWTTRWHKAAGVEQSSRNSSSDVEVAEPVRNIRSTPQELKDAIRRAPRPKNPPRGFGMRWLGWRAESALAAVILAFGMIVVTMMHLTWPEPEVPAMAYSVGGDVGITDLKPFEINDVSGKAIELLPGTAGERRVRLSNPNPVDIVVLTLQAEPGRPLNEKMESVSSCPVDVISVDSLSEPLVIPPVGSVEVTMIVRIADEVPYSCKDLIFPLLYSGRASRG